MLCGDTHQLIHTYRLNALYGEPFLFYYLHQGMTNKYSISAVLAVTAALLAPVSVSAQATVTSLTTTISGLINYSIGALIGIAIIAFFWGLVKYLFQNGSAEKGKGAKLMIYGIVTLTVMLSLYGIIRLLQNSTVGPDTGPLKPPVYPSQY